MASGSKRHTNWSTAARDVVDTLFVYGTLRQGHAARSLVAEHIASAVPATTHGRIFALPAGYPGMIADDEAVVVGELVQLADLPAALLLLDAYEGAEFVRVLQRVIPRGGSERWAWCYLLADPALAKTGLLIESGDWNDFARSL